MDYEDPKTIRRKKRYYKYVKKMKLFRQLQKIWEAERLEKMNSEIEWRRNRHQNRNT